MKTLILVALTIMTSWSYAGTRDNDCILGDEAREISRSFRGITLGDPYNLDLYCESDLGPKKFKLFKVIERIRQISNLDLTDHTEDAMAAAPIQESDWWTYFETRVREIQMPRKGISDSSCRENVMAYVLRPQRGKIFLCPHFFKDFTINDLVATFMHEARHFDDDGHPHAICSGGTFEGLHACDNTITEHGSYAVGVQTLVRLAKDPTNSALDKYELEARALYQANNKFNIKPEVNITETLVVSNSQGDVFTGDPGNLTYERTLRPHRILAYTRTTRSNSFTTISKDPRDLSRRVLPDFRTDTPHRLTLQRVYDNSINKDRFVDLDFLATPALLTDNQVISTCGTSEAQFIDIEGLKPKSLINYKSENDKTIKSVVLSNGSLLDVVCTDGDLSVEGSRHSLNENLIHFGIKETVMRYGVLYGLLGNGQVVEISVEQNEINISNPLALEGEWDNLTKIERPSIFE